VSEQAGGRPRTAELLAAVPARVNALRADTRLRPDAVSALTAIRNKGLSTALISDCTHELPALLPSLPVASLLDVQVFSVEVGMCKPDPEIYLTACRRLGVEPAECVYVGDGGSRELTGAATVGMTPVRLDASDLVNHLVFDRDDAFLGPAVSSLTELVTFIDRSPALV
jgi:putative hydrolase of the HAD superfamily